MDDRRVRLVVIIRAVAAVIALIGVYANRHPVPGTATTPPVAKKPRCASGNPLNYEETKEPPMDNRIVIIALVLLVVVGLITLYGGSSLTPTGSSPR